MSALRKVILIAALALAAAIPGLGTLIAAGVVAIALAAFSDARSTTFKRGPWWYSLGIGVLCGMAIAALMGFIVNPLLNDLFETSSDLSALGDVEANTSAYIRLLALGLLYGPIVEEVIFRGFVIGWGSQLWGPRAAGLLTIISAVIFGITHLYQGWVGVFSTGIIGLGYGLVYVLTKRNILTAVFTHMTLNGIGITLLYMGI